MWTFSPISGIVTVTRQRPSTHVWGTVYGCFRDICESATGQTMLLSRVALAVFRAR